MFKKQLCTVAMATLFCSVLNAQFAGFRMPKSPEFSPSSTFTVEIRQNEAPAVVVPVTKYIVPEAGMVTKTENFAMFGFEPLSGAITICVSMMNGMVLNENEIEVVNKQVPVLQWHFEKGKLYITTKDNRCQILVRLKKDYSNQLVLMANPYTERAIAADAKVVTFAYATSPNIQTAQYDRYSVPNDVDVVYFEEGAVLKGTIHTMPGRSKPLILMGRGVVIGNGRIVNGKNGIPYNAIELTHGSGHIIDGITTISPRHFSVRASDNALVTNVKMFGYNANVDGVVAGNGSIIENCYSKVNDDHVKLYNNNMIVRNCCFYEQTNGGLFQLAWNSIKPGSNCLVENCEILAWEAKCGDPKKLDSGIARSVINLRESSSAPVSINNTFRNIRIQGKISRLIGINGNYGSSKPLSLKNYTLENVVIDNEPDNASWMYTGGNHMLSFNFYNVTIGGIPLLKNNFKVNTEGNVQLNFGAIPQN